MDTSETYIKMSFKAKKEINEYLSSRKDGCPYEPGDVLSFYEHILTFMQATRDTLQTTMQNGMPYYILAENVGSIIPLLRQDQLQEMVGTKETLPKLIIQDKLAHFAMWVRYQCKTPYTSMEQLWLAFVMKECYNKVWLIEKNEWVSISESSAQNAKGNVL